MCTTRSHTLHAHVVSVRSKSMPVVFEFKSVDHEIDGHHDPRLMSEAKDGIAQVKRKGACWLLLAVCWLYTSVLAVCCVTGRFDCPWTVHI